MAKKKIAIQKVSSKEIKEQEITEEGGLVEGVYITRFSAASMVKSVRTNLDRMKEHDFANRLDSPSVKLYVEALEHKIAQAERVANFSIKNQKKK